MTCARKACASPRAVRKALVSGDLAEAAAEEPT